MYVKYVLSTDSGDYTNDMAEEGEDFSLQMRWQIGILIPTYATTLASPKTMLLSMMISTNIPRILLLIWRHQQMLPRL